MRVVVAGMGVQGAKRARVAGADVVATVDPVADGVDHRRLTDVPVDSYDAVLACIPDEPKLELLNHCVENAKHVLVEKPLWAPDDAAIAHLEAAARQRGVVIHTAYNHRFEPHFLRMRDLIDSGELGRIYSCRMFYGNGTARLVRRSAWRDKGGGVIPDLGSHLLDTCRVWFGEPAAADITLVSADRFENRAPDHAIVIGENMRPRIELEMTYLMWRNHFTCDLLAERGSAHIRSLCKWGPSTFAHRTRVLPGGRPPEQQITRIEADPTWAAEYAHFRQLVAAGAATDLSGDRWLHRVLERLVREAGPSAQGVER